MKHSPHVAQKTIQWAQLSVLGAACLLMVLVLYTRHFTSPLETSQLSLTQASLVLALLAMTIRVFAPHVAKRLIAAKSTDGNRKVSNDHQLARTFLVQTLFSVSILSTAAFGCFLAYLVEGHAIALATGTIMFGSVVLQYRSSEAIQRWMQLQSATV